MAKKRKLWPLLIRFFFIRWKGRGGYLEFFRIAFPLILSTSAWTVQNIIDRVFLSWYSHEAMAATLPAGMLNYSLMSFFIGTVGYVDVFVAQYYGAGQNKKIGAVLWQGIYITLFASLVVMLAAPFSRTIFTWVGHEPVIREYEITYFRVLCWGAFPAIAATTLAAFFAGQGKAWTLVWVNVVGTLVNLVLDYFLIFGYGPFPRWGMTGAAIATVAGSIATFILYAILIFRPATDRVYHTLRAWRMQWELFWRLVRFGTPNGVQFLMDMFGFTVFILIMGSLGTINLAATNIAFNINNIAFMPMLGSGIAASILVGQHLGRNQPDLAEKSAYAGFQLCFFYMSMIAVCYLVVPDIFIKPFMGNDNAAAYADIQKLVRDLLKFVAFYSLFDAMNIIYSSAIKGAGDTKYVMWMQGIIAIFSLVIPSYVALVILPGGIYAAWTIVTVYGVLLGILFWVRFLRGKWKHMRVIEPDVSQ